MYKAYMNEGMGAGVEGYIIFSDGLTLGVRAIE